MCKFENEANQQIISNLTIVNKQFELIAMSCRGFPRHLFINEKDSSTRSE